jgi:hypothetical protein
LSTTPADTFHTLCALSTSWEADEVITLPLAEVLAPEELEELLDELELVTPLELEELELLLDEVVVPEELELPTVVATVTATVATAGDPKLAWPSTLVSSTVNCLPAAWLVTGTESLLTPESPSPQLTLPLVAV